MSANVFAIFFSRDKIDLRQKKATIGSRPSSDLVRIEKRNWRKELLVSCFFQFSMSNKLYESLDATSISVSEKFLRRNFHSDLEPLRRTGREMSRRTIVVAQFLPGFVAKSKSLSRCFPEENANLHSERRRDFSNRWFYQSAKRGESQRQ